MTRYRSNLIEGGNHIGMADKLDCDSDEGARLETDDFFIHQNPYTIELWRNYRILQV